MNLGSELTDETWTTANSSGWTENTINSYGQYLTSAKQALGKIAARDAIAMRGYSNFADLGESISVEGLDILCSSARKLTFQSGPFVNQAFIGSGSILASTINEITGVGKSCVLAAVIDVSGSTSLPLTTRANIARSNDKLASYDRYSIQNWDGYGADPISKQTIDAAREFIALLPKTLGEPDIAPGTDGSIGLEWAPNDRPLKKLFIDIGPGTIWNGYWRLSSGQHQTLPPTKISMMTRFELIQLFAKLAS